MIESAAAIVPRPALALPGVGWAALLATTVLVAVVAAVGWYLAARRSRADRAALAAEIEATRHEAEQLRQRVDALAAQHAEQASGDSPQRSDQEFLITDLGEPSADEPARIDGRLFTDLVVRESVVKAAALAHGVRRALAPEVRYRIRAEMKREIKRSRKERKAQQREFVRAQRQSQRGATDPATSFVSQPITQPRDESAA